MDEHINNDSPEELQAETEALAEVKDDDLRSKLAEELGIDPDSNSELLDKVVAREKSSREKFSKAIKQKIGWRDKANKVAPQKPSDGNGNSQPGTASSREQFDEWYRERRDQEDLDSLELPDELKEQVKTVAKTRGVSIKEAAKDPYIQFLKEKADSEARIKAATPKKGGRGSYSAPDPSKPLNPSDYNLNTEEGREAWKQARAARDNYIAQQKK